jgi:hypothetical protein
MKLRANFDKNYLWRYLAFAGVCFPLCLWFFYDGLIGYPKQLPMTKAYDELRDIDDPKKRKEAWQEIARKHDWPLKEPEKSTEELESDIVGQYLFGGLCIPVWVTALIYYFRCRGSWIERSADGVVSSWGQTLDFAWVQKLDKKKWARKGIATASYEHAGERGTFVFDDYKFERGPLDRIVYELEQAIGPEKIVGGPPETQPAEISPQPPAEPADGESLKVGS